MAAPLIGSGADLATARGERGVAAAPALPAQRTRGPDERGVTTRYREPDFEAVLLALPEPTVILTVDLVVRHVNTAFLASTGTTRAEVLDRHLIDEVFPDRPGDAAPGRRRLRESFHDVTSGASADVAGVSRYDLVAPGGTWPIPRYWSPVNSPIAGADGHTRFIVHRVQDVTAARGLLASMVTATSSIVEARNHGAVNEMTLVAQDLRRTSELPDDLAAQFENLLTLLDARALIEQAKGMLMAARRLTADEAFDVLKRRSQCENLKLRDVAARHVVLHSAATSAPTAP